MKTYTIVLIGRAGLLIKENFAARLYLAWFNERFRPQMLSEVYIGSSFIAKVRTEGEISPEETTRRLGYYTDLTDFRMCADRSESDKP